MNKSKGRPIGATDKSVINRNIKNSGFSEEEKKLLEIFTTRFNSEFEKKEIKLEDFSETIGIAKSTLSNYKNGLRMPNINVLLKIAKELNCSTDYLLGLTELKSNDIDFKKVHEVTGLSDGAIEYLKRCRIDYYNTIKDNDITPRLDKIKTLNYILENDRNFHFLKYCTDFLWVGERMNDHLKKVISNCKNEHIHEMQFLEHWRNYNQEIDRDQAIAKINMDKTLYNMDSNIRNINKVTEEQWIYEYKENKKEDSN